VPITKTLGVETDRAGRIKVLPDFSLPGHPRVFAIGDLATLIDASGVVVPGVAQGAMQAGAHVAREIAFDITTRERLPQERAAFRYHDKGNMATIGRSKAVAQIGRLHLRGFPAWAAWLAIHLVFLIGFRNRVSVFPQWVYAYFFHQRGARIITGLTFEKPSASRVERDHVDVA
jgi:NADH dehydrogenase